MSQTGNLFLWQMNQSGAVRSASYSDETRADPDPASRAERHERLRWRYGFAFDPVRALRADQLTQGSSETGQQPSGVVHALTVHDIHRGRLVRQAAQALCAPNLKPFEWAFADPDHPVTCPKCRAIMERSL